MRRLRYAAYVVWFSMVLCVLHPVAVFAEDWVVYVPSYTSPDIPHQTDVQPDDLEALDEVDLINDLATDSDWVATGSDADRVMPAAGYDPYDGSMSSGVVSYFDGVVDKLGSVHYVLFRSGQYDYRLVYGKDLVLSGSVFSGRDCNYVSYSTRYYTWSSGSEGNFSLSADGYLVYSDLGGYPSLSSSNVAVWMVAFCFVIYLLFVMLRAIFATHHMIV